jgi:dihydropyrimidine dehydrogenase (NAD+) subunit PreA
VSLINTINSITSVDLDSMCPSPVIDGKGAMAAIAVRR